jgi:integrase
LACDILKEWKKEQGLESLHVFPSPRKPGKPIRNVKRAWRTTLEEAGVPYFPIYNLRHVFCITTQLGRSRCRGAAGDAAQQSRDETPLPTRNVDQVREGIERANEKAYQNQ